MRVMAFGTFDNLHPGHLSYLKQAGNLGDELVVVVARDINVKISKGRLPLENQSLRTKKLKLALKELDISGRVILGNIGDRFAIVKKHLPDIIALGYDQKVNIWSLKEVISKLDKPCQIKRLCSYYPEKYKSSFCHLTPPNKA